ncbi:hypothetical protein [Streptomyces sp. NPDC059802]|uniref:hypothetical protein n=1 Tax=Streptomyces sp. NPDC059802 TaxID=3346952 RepID=UPI003660647A
MPTVTLLLRRKTRVLHDGAPRPEVYAPWGDKVELDELTPRARALAEAFAQNGGRPGLVLMEQDALIRDTVPNWEHYYPDRGDQHPRRTFGNWATLLPSIPVGEPLSQGESSVTGAADARTTPVEWLEREVRTWPLDWYVVSATGCDPVPSMEAGAADCYLTPDTVLEYMRKGGRPMSVSAWDALRGTSYLPTPDRYVCGMPQWRPETIDAFMGRPVELWPVSRVAEHLGYAGSSATGSARKKLSLWRLPAAGRQPGRAGESLYDADQVKALQAARPGSGRRGAPRSTGGKFTSSKGRS